MERVIVLLHGSGKRGVSAVLLTLLLAVLGSTASLVHPVAANAVGVEAGDWFVYGDYGYEWASNWPGYNQTPDWVNMTWNYGEVQAVADGNVTLRSTILYRNGTEFSDVMTGNPLTGTGNVSIGIIPPDLEAGAAIPGNLTWYTEEPLHLVVNGTVTRRYGGAQRLVNYVNLTYPIRYDSTLYGQWNMSFHWDRASGIMCESFVTYRMNMTIDSTRYTMNMTMWSRITATSLWPARFPVHWEDHDFEVTATSNSTLSAFAFDQPTKALRFNVTGPATKGGHCNVTIPTQLLSGSPFTVLVNDAPVTYTATHNGTHTSLYFAYAHSTLEVAIIGTTAIPEFPSTWALTLVLVTVAAAVIFKNRYDR